MRLQSCHLQLAVRSSFRLWRVLVSAMISVGLGASLVVRPAGHRQQLAGAVIRHPYARACLFCNCIIPAV